MASLAGTTWQFVAAIYGAFPTFNGTFNADGSMNAIISPSPFAPGPVITLKGTWTQGPKNVSFTFQLFNDIGEVSGSGTHQAGDGQGTLFIVIGQSTSPSLNFQMMNVTS